MPDPIVAISIPSRYGDGRVIQQSEREATLADVQERFARWFGGTFPTKHGIGTFVYRPEGTAADWTVAEEIASVGAIAGEKANDDALREQCLALAREVATRLGQESVLLNWNGTFSFVEGTRAHARRRTAFGQLPRDRQRTHAALAWAWVRELDQVTNLLALDGWRPLLRDGGPAGFRSIAEWSTRAASTRCAFAWPKAEPPHPADLRHLPPRALLFARNERGITVWYRHSEGAAVSGPALIPFSADGMSVPELAIDLCVALLSRSERDLIDRLDRRRLTARFYTQYHDLYERLAKSIVACGITRARAYPEAQRFLGQLMFLRFVERKGWINGDPAYLRSAYRSGGRPYVLQTLKPLFDALDQPQARAARSPDIPFLNGGLFEGGSARVPDLGDEWFDPDDPESILGLFYGFEFTLDESARTGELVSVDPAMFGLVLESLCSEGERKSKGIHYTPPQIGYALAAEAITTRLARKIHAPEKKIRALLAGKEHGLSTQGLHQVRAALPKLRIIDPAVGSGSLLLACLDVLMSLSAACGTALGHLLVPGSTAWAEQCRVFIRECLFGVDIEADAIEVARLRLWLRLAVGAQKATPLPDLGYNLCVGDTLSGAVISPLLSTRLRAQLRLQYDKTDLARNRFAQALHSYQTVDPEDRSCLAKAKKELVEAESQLHAVLCGSDMSRGAAGVGFMWSAHFATVLLGPAPGFDVVIANPPYVRPMHQESSREDLRRRYQSMTVGDTDLYLAFVERALELAGQEGQVAFIMPNFARTKSGSALRRVLAGRGAVDRWVDFRDQQVFDSATNYTALLFATGKNRKRSSFWGHVVEDDSWRSTRGDTNWIHDVMARKVEYSGDGPWSVLTEEEQAFVDDLAAKSVPLRDLCSIGVGVQTSADGVFLFEDLTKAGPNLVSARPAGGKRPVELEASAVRPIAKGSADIRPLRYNASRWVLWPYGKDGALLTASVLERRMPRAWRYLKRNERKLGARERGRFANELWWRFGRHQGIRSSMAPKILVPSLLSRGCAVLDASGSIAFTASGAGGGGAWALMVREDTDVPIAWLLGYLNSSTCWRWFSILGDAKKGGWRGVDASILSRLPVPKWTSVGVDAVEQLLRRLDQREAKGVEAIQEELDAVFALAIR